MRVSVSVDVRNQPCVALVVNRKDCVEVEFAGEVLEQFWAEEMGRDRKREMRVKRRAEGWRDMVVGDKQSLYGVMRGGRKIGLYLSLYRLLCFMNTTDWST